MPKITAKSVYAIAALYYLLKKGSAATIEEIAKGANVPRNFLEQLLIALKKAGILTSIRGAHGGYKFSKPPKSITFLEVVRAVESECCTDPCRTQDPVLKLFWSDFSKSVQKLLDRPLTTLLDLEQPQMFYI